MHAIGNARTIAGIVVTFVAYFGGHSGVSLADLEPGLTARWNRARAWARRRLGRTNSYSVAGTAAATSSIGTPTVTVWSPVEPADDIAVRVEKLGRNIDSLRAHIDESRKLDLQRAREDADLVTQRIDALDQLMATRHQETEQRATAAMRWEVRGLLITLVGAGLSIVG